MGPVPKDDRLTQFCVQFEGIHRPHHPTKPIHSPRLSPRKNKSLVPGHVIKAWPLEAHLFLSTSPGLHTASMLLSFSQPSSCSPYLL